jgi:hypothetical protein
LNEAAELIAQKLARVQPTRYPDAATALDDARRELLRALFDGAVYSRGVQWLGPPLADDPNEPPPLPEPISWHQIEPGWWSHERYDQYVYRHQETELELLLMQGLTGKDNKEPELIERIIEGTYLLDGIILSWKDNHFSVLYYHEHYEYARIQVSRDDLKRHFGVGQEEFNHEEPSQFVNHLPSSDVAKPIEANPAEKRRTKPASVRIAVYKWLNEIRDEKGDDWIKPKTNPWLANRYFKTSETAKGSADTVRKLVSTWRKERGLTLRRSSR